MHGFLQWGRRFRVCGFDHSSSPLAPTYMDTWCSIVIIIPGIVGVSKNSTFPLRNVVTMVTNEGISQYVYLITYFSHTVSASGNERDTLFIVLQFGVYCSFHVLQCLAYYMSHKHSFLNPIIIIYISQSLNFFVAETIFCCHCYFTGYLSKWFFEKKYYYRCAVAQENTKRTVQVIWTRRQ